MVEGGFFCYNVLMLRVEISIPRPIETLCLLSVAAGVALWMSWGDMPTGARARATVLPQTSSEAALPSGEGGADPAARAFAVKDAERTAQQVRSEQAVLSRREEILRYELTRLSAEAVRTGMPPAELQSAEAELNRLLADERVAEERFRETLNEMWEAEGISAQLALGTPESVRVQWPVEPDEGLSATFLDPAYEERFGISHHAVDIPVGQGSAIRAAADGVIEKIVDSGLGYSYLILKHDGFATLYGHVSAFFVAEGDRVRQGDVVAQSGGRPGTPGAGALTTGPHVHFEVIVEGERIDPLRVLPDRPGLNSVTQ